VLAVFRFFKIPKYVFFINSEIKILFSQSFFQYFYGEAHTQWVEVKKHFRNRILGEEEEDSKERLNVLDIFRITKRFHCTYFIRNGR
jgi:hypothetical protein